MPRSGVLSAGEWCWGEGLPEGLRILAPGTFPGVGPGPQSTFCIWGSSPERQRRPLWVGVPSGRRILPGGGPVCKGVKGQQGQNLGVVGQEPACQVDDPLVLLVGLGARRGGVLRPLPRGWAPGGPATSLSPVVGRNWGCVAPSGGGMLSAPSHPPEGLGRSVTASGCCPGCVSLQGGQWLWFRPPLPPNLGAASFCSHPSARCVWAGSAALSCAWVTRMQQAQAPARPAHLWALPPGSPGLSHGQDGSAEIGHVQALWPELTPVLPFVVRRSEKPAVAPGPCVRASERGPGDPRLRGPLLCRGRAQGETGRKPGLRPWHSQMFARVQAARGGREPGECCICHGLASDPGPDLRWLTARWAPPLGAGVGSG